MESVSVQTLYTLMPEGMDRDPFGCMINRKTEGDVMDDGGQTYVPEVFWEIFIPFKPVPCPRPRVTSRGTYMPGDYTKIKKRHADFLCGTYPFDVIDFPVEVHLFFHIPKPKTVRREFPCVRPDVDNYSKSILDAITLAGIWTDDCLVTDLISRKRYGEAGKFGTDVVIVRL